MPRDLPSRPDLTHLKKQAKGLLPEIQRRNPRAKLADAQHAIAREHGFATWAKLKAHVLAQTAAPAEPVKVNYAFDRYTPRARQALFFSRFEASEQGKRAIEPPHLLCALMRVSAGPSSSVFAGIDLNVEEARRALSGASVAVARVPSEVAIPFGDDTKRILRVAVEESARLAHDRIGLAHIVLGMLREEQSPVATLLKERGMQTEEVRRQVDVTLAAEG